MTKREMYLEMYDNTNYRRSDWEINRHINMVKKDRMEKVYEYYLKEKERLENEGKQDTVKNLAQFCITVL